MNKNTANLLKVSARDNGRLEIFAQFTDGCSYMELVSETINDETLAKSLSKNTSLIRYASEPWEITFVEEVSRVYYGKNLNTAASLLLSYILMRNSDYDY